MKFAGDRVDRTDLRMDVWLLGKGFRVRYDVIPHPVTGRVTPRGDLRRLMTNDIPYKVWGIEFWRLGRGEGLLAAMTWEPKESRIATEAS